MTRKRIFLPGRIYHYLPVKKKTTFKTDIVILIKTSKNIIKKQRRFFYVNSKYQIV